MASEKLEQFLHFWAGFLGSLVFVDRLIVWWREFRQQAPIERLDDTERDYLFWAIGGTVGNLVQAGSVLVMAWRWL